MIELYHWKHPRTGQKRYYLNTWKEAIGLSLNYYNTGNIRAASLRGEGISNSKARQIHMKLWFDEEKNLHIDGFNGGRGSITEDEVREYVSEYLANNGGLELLD